jgi:hypothetical protein
MLSGGRPKLGKGIILMVMGCHSLEYQRSGAVDEGAAKKENSWDRVLDTGQHETFT